MLTSKIKNITFNSPIMLSSGTFGYGYEAIDLIDQNKIGCIITKSLTLKKRDGNKHSRIHESPSGMLNAIGLANVGLEKFIQSKLSKLNTINTNFMISIAGSTIDEYLDILKVLEKSNGKHIGYEINVSCPNIKEGGLEFGVNAEIIYDLISGLRDLTTKIIIVKLTPNVTYIEEIALSAESAGADAISAVNTFLGMSIDYKTGKTHLNTKFGGVSGPAIKPLAVAKINKIFQKVKIPIIGMGGISSYKDIIEFMRAGSTMIQIGTLNYRNPSLSDQFFDDLLNFCKINNINNISELIGKNYAE